MFIGPDNSSLLKTLALRALGSAGFAAGHSRTEGLGAGYKETSKVEKTGESKESAQRDGTLRWAIAIERRMQLKRATNK